MFRGGSKGEAVHGFFLPGQYLRSILPTDLTHCNQANSFLQSGFWGSFKARFGWNTRAFLADWGAWGIRPLLLIRRRLGPWFSFAYVPWGPELPEDFPAQDEARNQALQELAGALQAFLPENTAFIRFDPPWYTEGPETAPPQIYPPFARAGVPVQAADTVVVDLTGSEESILKNMKSKWRYNIQLAHKKGVLVRQAGEEELNRFYELLKETAKRDSIAVHSSEYYTTLFSHCRDYMQEGQDRERMDLRLYLAEHEGELLAAVVVLFRGNSGVYLYGASSNHKRNLMAPYALQWKAIQDARSQGCRVYDLFGIPPREDPAHPMAGLYRFKIGFGGRIIHRPGSWDYTYRPLVRGLFNTLEALRKRMRKVRRIVQKLPGRQ
ncbi:MAG: peptidoglycan bridge formation glycyltransferase FemA/FemB family protein [Treponema sp.]|jgi:lipid II:glycine glycyltransferase (peptidoglycan interpeptide bridge formation enzyme)|nr:peptidoglycan bridge formation glycyltransferase FemA/FemB family protein [Treponema sp.]